MNTAIYVRVSTEQQAEKGYSIATQLEACRKYALELGATQIDEFIDDGYSGEFIDRPALTRLREGLVKKSYQAVIAYAPDRLSRNTIHLLIISEEIEKAGAMRKFASVNFEATPEGELMYKFQGIVAEYEKEKIKERTMRGKRGKAAKGLVISNTKPFGYIYDKENSTYTINNAEAEVVRLIFDLVIKEKMGTARISRELNARGIPSPRKKNKWIVSSIHRILTNTLYKGILYSMKYRYQKTGLNKKKRTLRPEAEWLPIYVPRIITAETWQAAQQQLQQNKDLAKRNIKHDYLLNGLVTCAVCGSAMVISHSGCKKYISYYACLSQKSTSHRYQEQARCSARQIPTELLDKNVYNYLQKFFFSTHRIAEIIEAVSNNTNKEQEAALLQIRKTEKKLFKQKEAVLRWYNQNRLNEAETECQLDNISKQLAEISEIVKDYQTIETSRSSSMDALLQTNINFNTFTTDEKKAALKAIISNIKAKRIDTTRGHSSCPEIIAEITLK